MTVGVFSTGQFTNDLPSKSFAAAFTRLFPNGIGSRTETLALNESISATVSLGSSDIADSG